MAGSYLLDTNIVVAVFANESQVVAKIREAEGLFVPSVVLGELYYGARKSSHVADNLTRIEQFATQCAVLSCDRDTARLYGQIKSDLRSRGRPIPENDIWVAAVAQQHNLTLVTRDAHFGDVEELEVHTW